MDDLASLWDYVIGNVDDPLQRALTLSEVARFDWHPERTPLDDPDRDAYDLSTILAKYTGRIHDIVTITRALAIAQFNKTEKEHIKLEATLNSLLAEIYKNLMNDESWHRQFSQMFPQESARVYTEKAKLQVNQSGQRPNWEPHESHMRHLELIWKGVEDFLKSQNLQIDQPLRKAFKASFEDEITAAEHVRTFYSTLIDTSTNKPQFYFELSVPHSHVDVNYSVPPQIRLSPCTLLN